MSCACVSVPLAILMVSSVVRSAFLVMMTVAGAAFTTCVSSRLNTTSPVVASVT